MSRYAIGIDVGGTWIRVALVDGDMKVLKRANARTSDFTNIDLFLDGLKLMIDEVDETKIANQIGMVIPTPWKDDMTHFQDATNVPFLEEVAIEHVKNHFLKHHIFFENDVNVIALLESEMDERKAYDSLMYITVSTGIGSGIVAGGKLWQGAQGYAGEVGNMIVSEKNEDLVIVLEDVCSGLALDVAAKTLYGSHATAESLFEAYQQNDERAIDTIESWIETFSDAMASLMHVINPEIFILGGSVINNNRWLIKEVINKTKPKLFENLREHLNIELSHYGEDSGILGGAQLCFSQKIINT